MATHRTTLVFMLIATVTTVSALAVVEESKVKGWEELDVESLVNHSSDLDVLLEDGRGCRIHGYYDPETLSTESGKDLCLLNLLQAVGEKDSSSSGMEGEADVYYGRTSDSSCVIICDTDSFSPTDKSSTSGSAVALKSSSIFCTVGLALLSILMAVGHC